MTRALRWSRRLVVGGVVLALGAPAALADDAVPWGVDLPRPLPGAPGSATAPEVAAAPEGAAARAPEVAAAGSSTWTLSGSGWGHGVGMSQYGAYGMARDGYSAAEILRHYYSGTAYEQRDDDVTVRVNVRNRASSVSMRTSALSGGGGSFTVTVYLGRDAEGNDVVETISGGAGQRVTVTPSGSSMKVTCSSCSGRTTSTGARPTIRWDDDRTLMAVDGAATYKDGLLRVTRTPGASTLEASVYARVHDEYLDYLREVPWSWPSAALEAQAAAARGYALRKQAAGVSSTCNCHLYDDTRSQVFGGYPTDSDTRRYLPAWTSAVDAAGSATRGYVATYGGSIIDAYYSSSSGGRTQNSEDVWSAALPYLRSVDDHWAQEPANPRAHWTTRPSRSTLASAFGLSDVARLDLSDRLVSGAVATARATSSAGVTRSLSGESLRSRLGLSSTYLERDTVRVEGANRYAVAAAFAHDRLPQASTLVLASGEDAGRADAVVSGPLAQSLDAPLLLTRATALPRATTDELDARRGTLRRVVVVGGPATVSEDVVARLESRGLEVRRISGGNRYIVAGRAARDIATREAVRSVVVASGTSLADALGAGGPAGAVGEPILLTRPDELPTTALDAIEAVGAGSARVLGGEVSVSEDVVDTLRESAGLSVRRLGGATRYDVAVAVAEFYRPRLPSVTQVSVASGADAALADALTAGSAGRMTLLTRRSGLPAGTARVLQESGDVARVSVLGGPVSVADPVLVEVARS